jgi:DNA (cytosine-5)-methyltransferase 1
VSGGKLKVLSLFAGIGGFDLGLERTNGFETVALCEIDPFCRRVLAKHWPQVPCYPDIQELNGDAIYADVVVGGFPCQAFSTAARGRNNAADLWPEYARIATEVEPRFCIAENVAREPIERAAEHFRSLGLSCLTLRISADDIGADHERVRWWAIAHPYSNGELLSTVHAEMARMRSLRQRVWGPEAYRAAIRFSDGLPPGLDPPGPYGNAVVPQIPELIGRAILASLEQAEAA